MKVKKITRKQKAFADEIIANPKITGTDAALKTYDTESKGMAAVIATKNLQNPVVQAYMQKHSDLAQEAMLELLAHSRIFAKGGDKEGAAYAGVAFNISKDIMDRVHGKATQRTEVSTNSVSINIDLSGTAELTE